MGPNTKRSQINEEKKKLTSIALPVKRNTAKKNNIKSKGGNKENIQEKINTQNKRLNGEKKQ